MRHRNPSTYHRWSRRRGQRGFNLVEMLVVMAIIMIIAAIGMPEMRRLMLRLKLEGAVQGVAQVVGQARGEAVRRGAPVVVWADSTTHELVAFADVNNPIPSAGTTNYVHALFFDPEAEVNDLTPQPTLPMPHGSTDYEVARFRLPGSATEGNGIYFWNATQDTYGGTIVDRLTTNGNTSATSGNADMKQVAVFEPDGTIRDVGCFLIGMGAQNLGVAPQSDEQRNFFAVCIEPEATARIVTKKWVLTPVTPATSLTGPTAGTAGYEEKMKAGPDPDDGWNWVWY